MNWKTSGAYNRGRRRIALNVINGSLKLKLVQITFNNSLRISKRTPHLTITKIKWLTLFKEIIAVYTKNQIKPKNIKYRVTDY
jgi:hypothetical protein